MLKGKVIAFVLIFTVLLSSCSIPAELQESGGSVAAPTLATIEQPPGQTEEAPAEPGESSGSVAVPTLATIVQPPGQAEEAPEESQEEPSGAVPVKDTAPDEAYPVQEATPTIASPSAGKVWISLSEIAQLPTSGPAWETVLESAESDWGEANVADQDSGHDIYTMSGALVCARTGEYCTKTVHELKEAIGTEDGKRSRWLAVGRNMTAYTIAADILRAKGALTGQDLEDVNNWLGGFLTRTLPHNNTGEPQEFIPFASGSNASAQEGAVYAAIAVYLGEEAPEIIHPQTGLAIEGTQHIERAWDAFRRYACDQTAPDNEDIVMHEESGWAFYNPAGRKKCGVNPVNASTVIKEYPGFPDYPTEMRTDGAIINDMDRGCNPRWEPCHTNYPWVGLEGFVPAAYILHRAGYPAFELQDMAVFRAIDFLWWLDERTGDEDWFLKDGNKGDEIVFLVKAVYGRACNPIDGKDCLSEWQDAAVGGGRTIGFTDWTHSRMMPLDIVVPISQQQTDELTSSRRDEQ